MTNGLEFEHIDGMEQNGFERLDNKSINLLD
jgi:hypothetical protein